MDNIQWRHFIHYNFIRNTTLIDFYREWSFLSHICKLHWTFHTQVRGLEFFQKKIKKEEDFSRLNMAKINQHWHQILRKAKCKEMKENVEVSDETTLNLLNVLRITFSIFFCEIIIIYSNVVLNIMCLYFQIYEEIN